jgi:hypothetical protein
MCTLKFKQSLSFVMRYRVSIGICIGTNEECRIGCSWDSYGFQHYNQPKQSSIISHRKHQLLQHILFAARSMNSQSDLVKILLDSSKDNLCWHVFHKQLFQCMGGIIAFNLVSSSMDLCFCHSLRSRLNPNERDKMANPCKDDIHVTYRFFEDITHPRNLCLMPDSC